MTQGTVTVAAAGTADVIATPGANGRLHITRGVVSISVVGAAGTVVSLDDGTTTIWAVAASDVSQLISHSFDWGEDGYKLDKNKALCLTVTGGDATAIATFVGFVFGNA